MLQYKIYANDGLARVGRITTGTHIIDTPAFMPVGTAASVKAVLPWQLHDMGAQCLLANCYHLMLRPGAERVAQLGGLHQFMNWQGALLTDSGGFQVMSLARLRQIEAGGVRFQSHLDGSQHFLTPEHSIEVQSLLGSNIQMVLDECLALPATYRDMRRAMKLSLDWAERSKSAFEAQMRLKPKANRAALFGIQQGGIDEGLRLQSSKMLQKIGFDGYAIGGLAVGEGQATMLDVLAYSIPSFPKTQPRYLMGVGSPDDVVRAVAVGVDMFDCALPTRAGRHGTAYGWFGKLNLRNAKHATDPQPLDELSSCSASRDFSRAYLHHLFKAGEFLAPIIVSWHNLHFYQELMLALRQHIAQGQLQQFLDAWDNGQAMGPSCDNHQA